MANDNGVQVKVGLDAKTFNREMSNVNRSLRVLDSEFKKSKAEMGGFEKGIDQMKLKSSDLSKKLVVQRDKVKLLSDQYKRIKQTKGEDNAETQKMLIKLNKAETQMSNMKNELKKTNEVIRTQGDKWRQLGEKINKVGDKFKSVGQKMTSVGHNMTMKITAPLIGLGIASGKAGIDFESAMSTVKATTQTTEKELSSLKNKAKSLIKTEDGFSISSIESAKSMNYLGLAGYNTNEILSSLEPIMRAGVIAGGDMATSADLATDSLSALGLHASDAKGYLDGLAQTSRSANSNIGQLEEAYIACGGKLKQFNVPLNESNTILAVMANRGIKGAESGKALSSTLANMTLGVGRAGKAMKKLGMTAFDNNGKFKGLENIMKELYIRTKDMTDVDKDYYLGMIAGKEQQKALQAIMSGVGDEYDSTKIKIMNCNGALNEMSNEIQNNSKGSLRKFKNTLQNTGTVIFKILKPSIDSLTEKLTNATEWFNSLTEGQQKFIVKIGLLVTSIGPFLIVAGKMSVGIEAIMKSTKHLINGIKIFKGVLKTARTAQIMFNAVLTANPIGIVVTAIATLVAGLILLYNHSDKARKIMDKFFGGILEGAKWLGGNVKNAFDSLIDSIGELNNNADKSMKELKKCIEKNGGGIKGTVLTLGNSCLNIGKGLFNKINDLTGGKLNGIKNLFKKFSGDLPLTAKNLPKIFYNIGKNILEGLKNGIKSLAHKPIELMQNIGNGIKNNIKSVLGIHSPSKIMQKYGQYIDEGLINGMKDGEDDVLQQAKNIAKGIEDNIKINEDKLRDFGNEVVNALKAQYDELEQIEIDKIDGRIKKETNATNEILKLKDKEYMAYLKINNREAYDRIRGKQKQLKDINEQTKKEEKLIEQQAQKKKIIRLQEAISQAKTSKDRKKAEEELNEYLTELDRKVLLQKREEKKKQLTLEIEEELKATKNKIKADSELKVTNMENEKTEIQKHYDELKDQYNIENEAIRLMTAENQDELIDLLTEYNPKWQDAGQSLTDKLLNGLNSNKESISDAVKNMINVAPTIETQKIALEGLNKEIAELQKQADQASKKATGTSGSFETMGDVAIDTSTDLDKLTNKEKDVADNSDLTGNKIETNTDKIKTKIDEYISKNNDMVTTLNTAYTSVNGITEDMANDVITSYDDMVNDTNKSITEKENAEITSMNKLFETSTTITEDEKTAILETVKQKYEDMKTKNTKGQKDIERILNKAKKEKRNITDKEKTIINGIQDDMCKQACETLTDNETDQKILFDDMKNNAKDITEQQCVDVVANSLQQKNDTIVNAKLEYDKNIEYAEKLRKDGTGKSKEMADAIIKEAKRQYNDTVEQAENQHEDIVEEMKNLMGDEADEINWEKGEVKTQWDKTKEGIYDTFISIKKTISSGIDKIREWNAQSVKEKVFSIVHKIKEVFTSSGHSSSNKPKHNATGTQDFTGGLTYVSEKGNELIKEPNGINYIAENEQLLNLPRHTKIFTNTQTRKIMSGEVYKNNSNTNLTIDYNKLADAIANKLGKTKQSITQNLTINSNRPLSPSETARKNKQMLQQLALQFN